MATTNVEFIFNNLQSDLAGAAAVTAIPFVQAMEKKAAQLATGNIQGGAASFNQLPSVATNSLVLLSDISKYGFAKNGCTHITTSGSMAVVIDFTNLATLATTNAGDTVFTTVYYLAAWNLSGLDGVAAANMTLGATAAHPFGLNGILVATPITLPPSQPQILWLGTAGSAVAAGTRQITVTPTAGGNFALVVGGA